MSKNSRNFKKLRHNNDNYSRKKSAGSENLASAMLLLFWSELAVQVILKAQ